jgi:hypothetical protein
MGGWIHYLDADDVVACGCQEDHPSWTFASGRVTCPHCRRVLEARRGSRWMDELAADVDMKRPQWKPE